MACIITNCALTISSMLELANFLFSYPLFNPMNLLYLTSIFLDNFINFVKITPVMIVLPKSSKNIFNYLVFFYQLPPGVKL